MTNHDHRQRHTVWWSAGAASTVAGMLYLRDNPNADVTFIYTDPGGEHEDNVRFRKDVEQWLGIKIVVMKSDKYVDQWDVFEKTGWLIGPSGTRCTVELKKKLRQAYEDPDDLQVFGYTAEEQKRADRFRHANPDVRLVTPLIDHNVTKPQCLGVLQTAGIALPAAYLPPYKLPNANCIGCPHGGMGYWNQIRIVRPDVFDRMAKLERKLGVAVCRSGGVPVFLDELDPKRGNLLKEPTIECGPLCIPEDDDTEIELAAPAQLTLGWNVQNNNAPDGQ